MEVFLIVLASVAVLAVLIALQYVVSKEFYSAAVLKGYNEKKYFWYGFFFGAVGYLLIIALPNRNNMPNQLKQNSADELPEI